MPNVHLHLFVNRKVIFIGFPIRNFTRNNAIELSEFSSTTLHPTINRCKQAMQTGIYDAFRTALEANMLIFYKNCSTSCKIN